jgi:hypothetical protein
MIRILVLILLLASQLLFSQKQQPDYVFQNVNVVSMQDNAILKQQNVAVLNGKIVEISTKKIKGKTVIDLKGKYIMPSLADAHVHFPENEDELERFLNLNLINGVTKMRSMRGNWKHVDWKKKYNTKNSVYPTFYLSAPPISRGQDFTLEQLDNFVKSSKEGDFKLIKILSIKSQELFKQLDSLCKKYDMPLGGHFPRLASGNNLSENVFFNSNYQSIEHLGGLVGEPDYYESRFKSIKENKIVICPTLSWYSIGSGRYSYDELRNLPGMQFVSQKIIEEWINKTKEYRERLGDEAYNKEVANELKSLDEKFKVIKRLHDFKIPMLLSPDSSSKYMIPGFGMVGEMELIKNSGLSNFEILKMATTNFATFFNENYGVLAVGKEADFIVLNDNPLESFEALNKIEGLYFNQNYLNSQALTELRKSLALKNN